MEDVVGDRSDIPCLHDLLRTTSLTRVSGSRLRYEHRQCFTKYLVIAEHVMHESG